MRTLAAVVALLGTTAIVISWPPTRAQEAFTKTRVDTSRLPSFENEPGWSWVKRPGRFRAGGRALVSNTAIADTVLIADGGALRIILVQSGSGRPVDDMTGTRLVVFDADGRRFLPRRDPVGHEVYGANGQYYVRYSTYTLDPKVLAPDKAAYLGIEAGPAGLIED